MKLAVSLASVLLLAAAPESELTQHDLLQKVAAAYGTFDPQATYHMDATRANDLRTTQILLDRHGSEFVRAFLTEGVTQADGFYRGRAWHQDANGTLFYQSRPAEIDTAVLPNPPDGTKAAARDADGNYVVTVQSRKLTTTVRMYAKVSAEQSPMGIPPAPSPFETEETSPFDLGARFDRAYVIVPVTINGRTMDFVLDSGNAAGMTIDPGAAHDLGLPLVARGHGEIGGEYDTASAIAHDVRIGKLTAKTLVFSVAPVSFHRAYTRIVGMIGADFFASNVVQVDYAKGHVTVIPYGAFDSAALGVPPQPARLEDGFVHIGAWFGGKHGDFVLDTGSPMTYLAQRFSDKVALEPGACQGERQANFIGGKTLARYCEVASVIIAGYEYKRAWVSLATTDAADLNDDGIIGWDILGGYTVTFDYQHGAVYLKPSK